VAQSPSVRSHRPSASRSPRRGLLGIACLTLLLSGACGEDSPTAPTEDPRVDTTELVALLNDPFVLVLTGSLEDQATAGGIQKSFSTSANVAAHEGVRSIRRSLLATHRSVERYRGSPEAGPGDPPILEALDLILLQAELLLDGPLGREPARIELH
jgi:hypothetical protein